MGRAHFSYEKDIFLRYFQRNISIILNYDNDSDAIIYNIQRLKGTANATYLVELISKNGDGLLEPKKILGKRFLIKGTNDRTGYLLALYGKSIFENRKVPTIQERIKAELYCAQKIKETIVKMPNIIYADLESGYIFTEFIQGTNIDDIIHQISLQKHIKYWQKKIFHQIGQGLAEINLKLKIVHGDTSTINWIYEEEKGKLYLTDWECAGKGDPAWDLAHFIYEVGADLGIQHQTIDLFDDIYSAIITGYAKVDIDEEIIKRFTGYWVHHALSVPPKIHEKIFRHQGIPLPRGFRICKFLHSPVINTHSPITKKQSVINRLLFRLWKIAITFYRFILLIQGKTNPEVVIIGD